MMNTEHLKHALEHHAGLIATLVADLTPEQARWKPSPDAWSILEVLNHLYDEEREDFRAHVKIALLHPEQPWPGIRPMEWVTERKYNQRDLATSLENFLNERKISLAWLNGLSNPDWETATKAPFGEIRAGDLFASWVIHDQWHIQQIIQLRRAYTIQQAAPYDVRYAGTL